jgi:branched-chain amino acid aminotransferase
MSDGRACWLNGHLVDPGTAGISVFDHGLLYGDGVFEGIRYYGRRAFRLREHFSRLFRSMRALALTPEFNEEVLEDAVVETIAAAGNNDGYLRLVITRGVGPLGIDPRRCDRPNTFIIASPLTMVSEETRARGARVIIAATRRLPPDGLDPRVKSLNYLNHILARMEAANAGADEAILLNHHGRVTEGTADNIFIVRDGALLTPPAIDGALEGITRGAILQIATRVGMNVQEASLAPYDLYTADECFLTGTGAELIPVREVDGRLMHRCPGPVFERLLALFRNQIMNECG